MVAFRCLTGRMPFVGEALGELLVQIIVGEIPSPSRIAPELPPSVDVWFARAVERDPDRRFQSARELVDALAAALGLDARGASVRPRASSAGESIDLVNVGDDDAARRTGMLAASTPGIARTYIGLGPWVERPRPLRFAIAAVVAASTIGAVVATLVWHRATSGGDPGQPPIASASGGATASGSAGSTTPGAAPTASAEPIGSAGDACERAGCVEPAGEAPRPPSGGGASAKAPSTAKPSPNRGARKVTKRYNPGF